MKQLHSFWLGRIGYGAGTSLMRALAEARAAGTYPDSLLLLEHDHVYTLGRRGSTQDILLDEVSLKREGIDVATTDRGGLVTYHGPGQLVGYPVLDLGPNASPAAYVEQLEQALIETLAGFGIQGERSEDARGVWVGDAKIAAIGVHVSAGITTHGFALNISPDLSKFEGIVPCGISDKQVTSIEALTGQKLPITLVAKRTARALGEVLEHEIAWPGPSSLDAFKAGSHV